MARDSRLQATRDRGDLGTAVGVGAVAIAFLLYDGIRRIVELFSTPGHVTAQAPIPSQNVTADIAGGVPATTQLVTLTVADVNLVSVICLVLSVAVFTVGMIAAAIFASLVCRRLLRNVVFDRVNTRLTLATSVSLLVAGLGSVWFRTLGLNGVFAALGAEFDGQSALFVEAIPALVGAFATGVLVIVFRRGAVLQRDTEGLV